MGSTLQVPGSEVVANLPAYFAFICVICEICGCISFPDPWLSSHEAKFQLRRLAHHAPVPGRLEGDLHLGANRHLVHRRAGEVGHEVDLRVRVQLHHGAVVRLLWLQQELTMEIPIF